MPRRSSTTSDSSLTRRQSARIAAASANKTPTPSPAKKAQRSSNRDSARKVEYAEDKADQNGTEEGSSTDEPVVKKSKPNEPAKSTKKPTKGTKKADNKDDLETKNDSITKLDSKSATKEAGCEVKEQSSIPTTICKEIKSTIPAQDEKIQASKDSPSVISKDKPSANGTEITSLCKGDNAADNSSDEQVATAVSDQKIIERQIEKPSTDEISK